LPTILCEIDPCDSSLKNSYVYANGQVLCQYEGETDPNRYFYVHDRLGSVRLVLDDNGTVKNSYTYNPFGEEFATESAENVSNPFKFTGQWFDERNRPVLPPCPNVCPSLDGSFTWMCC